MRTRHMEAQKGKGLPRTHSSWTTLRLVNPPHQCPWHPPQHRQAPGIPPKHSAASPALPSCLNTLTRVARAFTVPSPKHRPTHTFLTVPVCTHTPTSTPTRPQAHPHTYTQMLTDMSGAAHLHTQCHMHMCTHPYSRLRAHTLKGQSGAGGRLGSEAGPPVFSSFLHHLLAEWSWAHYLVY